MTTTIDRVKTESPEAQQEIQRFIQDVDQKNQVTSIWEYDDETHMNKSLRYLQ